MTELQKACERTGFYVFLANIEKTTFGSVDGPRASKYPHRIAGARYTIDDPFHTDFSLLRVIDLKGGIVAERVSSEAFLIATRMKRTIWGLQVTREPALPTCIAKRYAISIALQVALFSVFNGKTCPCHPHISFRWIILHPLRHRLFRL